MVVKRSLWGMMEKEHEQRTSEELREHYEIEKELADRLRVSSSEERKQLYAAIYDEFYRRVPFNLQLSRKLAAQKDVVGASPQWHFLSRFLRKDSVFLEIGAGTCGIALNVARSVKKAYALDVSEEAIKQAQGPENFVVTLFNGLSIPPLPESVTIAYSDQVMEHIHPNDALEQLKSIYDVLTPGGIYVCITPNGLNGPHDISRYFDQVATGFHLKEYTNTELSRLFRQAGFAKVRAYISIAGHYPRCPLIFIKLQEGTLRLLPSRLSRAIARVSLPWCVRLVGVKGQHE